MTRNTKYQLYLYNVFVTA